MLSNFNCAMPNNQYDLQVLKRFVDSFKQGKMIPKCQFSAQISLHEGKHIPSLQHRVQLIGARSPYNTLMLAINPPMLTSGTYYSIIIFIPSIAPHNFWLLVIYVAMCSLVPRQGEEGLGKEAIEYSRYILHQKISLKLALVYCMTNIVYLLCNH